MVDSDSRCGGEESRAEQQLVIPAGGGQVERAGQRLHAIAVASILARPLVRRPPAALVLGCVVVAAGFGWSNISSGATSP